VFLALLFSNAAAALASVGGLALGDPSLGAKRLCPRENLASRRARTTRNFNAKAVSRRSHVDSYQRALQTEGVWPRGRSRDSRLLGLVALERASEPRFRLALCRLDHDGRTLQPRVARLAGGAAVEGLNVFDG
jgi:hypothetical protein